MLKDTRKGCTLMLHLKWGKCLISLLLSTKTRAKTRTLGCGHNYYIHTYIYILGGGWGGEGRWTKPLCFVTGLQLPAMHEINSCWSGFCTLIWQQLNQIVIYRLWFFFHDYDFILLLFSSKLFHWHHALHMPLYYESSPLQSKELLQYLSFPFCNNLLWIFWDLHPELVIATKESIPVPVLPRWALPSQMMGHPESWKQLGQITYDLWKERLLAMVISYLVFRCKALTELW